MDAMNSIKRPTSLAQFIEQHPRLFILTGAGISTDSGIPDYRDKEGNWKRKQPVQHKAFMDDYAVRQRYWARSLIGWPVIRDAQPGSAHHALVQLEQRGNIHQLVTQNVDRLHQSAGSQQVIDLHGRSDQVRCMGCGQLSPRDEIHQRSALANPYFTNLTATAAPDGDADLENVDFSQFHVPDCQSCGGILKPDVVFFGDNVPKERVLSALDKLQQSDGLLVIGSSLMVYSGFRFCRRAHEWDIPICALNQGKTRADDLLSLKLDDAIAPTLASTLNQL
ncbi:NAD-dependent protein deacetylase [Pontibacterium sp.]|uniref:NAD-dependent protein deacetylase n=1 Tax=Pontibacterium sp. TaxID=2036026 RepID=UPI003514E498